MHKTVFCQNLLDNALRNSIHAKRKQCLVRFLSDLMDYDVTITVTEIGKKLSSNATVKSKINAANTFVNNYKLEGDMAKIYKGLAHFFWGNTKELVILVDWTGACSEGYHTLSASVVGSGRSIPIYHEVHEESVQENEQIQNDFLIHLKEIIPPGIAITVVTDAGFHRNWFEQVIALGWDVIGRIYSRYYYQLDGENFWRKAKEVEFGNIGTAKSLGKVKLGKTKKPLEGQLYTYKEKLSRKVRKKKNKYPSHDKAHSDYYKNGWVIFSTINKPAKVLITYYKKRMQIEQNFKDIKNEQLGVGLKRHLSSGKTRINMLFFIAVLLIIIAWWFGLMIETQNKHRSYQANTVKNKRVRSFVHLGRLAFRHEPELLDWNIFKKIVNDLQSNYQFFIDNGILA